MSDTQAELEQLFTLVQSTSEPASDLSDVITHPSSADYGSKTSVWNAHCQQAPAIVIEAQDLPQLQAVTKYLYESSLHFAIKNGGVGSTSARDVLLILSNFKELEFSAESETLSVGGGALWSDVDSYMAREAPGWAVVSSRTPFVGVVGQVLVGGLSWLSHEYGLVSDPQNLLDVQIILGNGNIVWGSQEQDLLWAIRGGKSAFGIITKLVFKARRYETDHMYAGMIRYPETRLNEVSAGVAAHVARNHDPKVAFHTLVLEPESSLFKSPPGVALQVFDAHGKYHGTSEHGFKWALDIPNAEDLTGEMSVYEVNSATDFAKKLFGKCSSHDATGLIEDVDPQLVARAYAWLQKVVQSDQRFAMGSYCLLEFTQQPAFGSTADLSATAFPHSRQKHVLQLGVGYLPEHAFLKGLALELLQEAFQTIPLHPCSKGNFTPTFIEPSVMDVRKIYGSNYNRIERIRRRFDKKGRFQSIVQLDEAE